VAEMEIQRKIVIVETSNGFLIYILDRQPVRIEIVGSDEDDSLPPPIKDMIHGLQRNLQRIAPSHGPREYQLVAKTPDEVMTLIGPIIGSWVQEEAQSQGGKPGS